MIPLMHSHSPLLMQLRALCGRRGVGLTPLHGTCQSSWLTSKAGAEVYGIEANTGPRKDRAKAYKFVDKVRIEVSGGRGGNGCVSYESLGPGRKRPDGGNGGKGGNVYVIADKSMTSFTMTTFHFNGGPGAHGGSAGLTGKRGKDVLIKVPCGTLISERREDDEHDYRGKFMPFNKKDEDDEEHEEDEFDGTEEDCGSGDEADYDDLRDDENDHEEEEEFLMADQMQQRQPARIVCVSDMIQTAQAEAKTQDGVETTENLSTQKYFKGSKKNRKRNQRRRQKKIEEEDMGMGSDAAGHHEDDTGEEDVIIDMDVPDIPIRLVEGGRPGVGNKVFSGTGTSRARSLPKTKLPGRQGDRRSLIFELKLIADVGLVGFPNAGKSSLLQALSNANPKIAAYPFTTLHPNIGVVEYSDTGRITVADIPGLIEGAHEDRGLGHDFLRHIIRTQVLLYVIDGAGTDEREPAEDLECLIEELRQYDSSLLDKPSFVFCNKADIKGTKIKRRRLAQAAERHGMMIIEGSALKGMELGKIANAVRQNVELVKKIR